MMIYPKLVSVAPREDYTLSLVYDGGEVRLYDFKPHLSHKFYSRLADYSLFSRVSAVDGELFWASGQDFCPHTLFENSVRVTPS